MSVSIVGSKVYWVDPWKNLFLLGVAIVFLLLAFREQFDYLLYMWFNKEEYSHAVMIPFISAFLIWQRVDRLRQMPFEGSWTGFWVVLAGVVLMFLGRQSALAVLVNYGMLVTLFGLALGYLGWQAFKVVFVPLLILFFMIPLPGFIYVGLSNKLQLVSSEIGVWFIRLFGISVYLEGNVIDLGSYKLQVVEACSGLRYLFPLVTLGFIAAYFFQGALWKRLLIFISSFPITVLMNSFRIGLIGVTVEYWGIEMAEGFLHDFEGWVVFMSCLLVLVAEMWILTKIGSERKTLREAFGLEFPSPPEEGIPFVKRKLSYPLMASAVILAFIASLSVLMPDKVEEIPARKLFAEFPSHLGEWRGKLNPLEQIYIDALRFDDYVQTQYVNSEQDRVGLFASYYASQITGNMPHSPRACLPGGGWNIVDLKQKVISNVQPVGSIQVNRVIIQNGEYRQLVYYWFQQRGRYISSEYLVKWYVFWDSLVRNRSDGALVRLTTFIPPGEKIEEGDKRLEAFARELVPVLKEYIPD
ncbi:exosortase D (VPLPA-CTERM-specific) [Thiogranum longum]|uniref:Exosortase D (VPLPA-CTERM-specific) n=1 Tax=Thiogranum longum TaxID=1537524 RepID=A0A4R1HD76_9GAMM|nr:VPLPA-CTERM-specific exosortase XrtD [Thiogranum longum]TCK19458.1 exosortase D (VPLPA-CTERM-specific) [Thiogranum longum]